jgi:hypothetical protein
MTPDTPNHPSSRNAEALRAWAKGLYTAEAATELLIRAFGGRFAEPHWPWVHDGADGTWIEFEIIPDHVGPLSGGETRLLMIVAGLGAGTPVDLSDVVSSLSRNNVALVLAALSHAAGAHEDVDMNHCRTAEGVVVIDPTSLRLGLEPLYPWPKP